MKTFLPQAYADMEGLHHWWEFGNNPKLTSDDKTSLQNPNRQSSMKRKYKTRRTGTSLDLNINKIDNNGNNDRNNNYEEGGNNEVYENIIHIIPKFFMFMGNLLLYNSLSSNVLQISEIDSSIIGKHWWDWGHRSSNSLFDYRNTKARKSVSKLTLESIKDSKERSLTNALVEEKGSPLRGIRIYTSYMFFLRP